MKNLNLRLVPVTEEISDKIFDMFQEIPHQEPSQDANVANGLTRDEFRKYCVILEMAGKNILLSYMVNKANYYILFDGKTPIGWFSLKCENLRESTLHAGHIAYTIRPTKRGLGYGTRGLKLLVNVAKELGYKRVCVTTDDVNSASIKMLLKNGFKKFGANTKMQKLTKSYYDKMSQYYLDLK